MMRVPQSLDYALRAIVLLALQPEGEYVAAGDLADRLNLPRRFVEQQVTLLARHGLVTCRRGANGGCALAVPASGITVLDVVSAIQGDVLDVPHVTGSVTSDLWSAAAMELGGFLSRTTVEQLAAQQRELEGAAATMYWI